MRAQDNDRSTRDERARTTPRAPAAAGGASRVGLMALQAGAGNAAVVQMLRRAGHPGAREQHRHSADCGHPQAGQAAPEVQRSTVQAVLRGPRRPLDDTTRAAPVQRAEGRGAPRIASAGRAPAVQRAAELADLAGGGNAGAFGQAVADAEPQGAGTVAIVPAVLSRTLDLMNIAEQYESGFEEGTAPADRFALVIGVNIRTRNPQDAATAQTLFTQKVNAFRTAWGNDRFRVAVIGFTWANHGAKAQETNQRTIPYGEIRDRIMRSPETTAMIAGLRAAGREHVYLHTSDADTASFATEAGPLFSAAAEQLDTGRLDVFSGGYTSPADRRTADDDVLIWHASQVDLAVRRAMAQVEPALVYYPEPNTFVKVHEHYDELEDGVTFGSGAQEGQQLMDSLHNNRYDGVKGDFDPKYAIATDMDRVGQKVGGHPRGTPVTDATIKQLFALAQTHARQQEWTKRVKQAFELTDVAACRALEALVFAGLTTENLSKLPAVLPETPIGAAAIDHAARKEPLKGIDSGLSRSRCTAPGWPMC